MLSEREQSLTVSVVTVSSCGKIVSACRSSVKDMPLTNDVRLSELCILFCLYIVSSTSRLAFSVRAVCTLNVHGNHTKMKESGIIMGG